MNTSIKRIIGAACLAATAASVTGQPDELIVTAPKETVDKSMPTGDRALGFAGPRGLVSREVYRGRRTRLLQHMRDNGYSAAVIFNDTRN